MAMINGNNASGKMFDVVDEDGDVLGSFDVVQDAIECGKTAPWYAGSVNIRRDISLNAKEHARMQKEARARRLEMDYAY